VDWNAVGRLEDWARPRYLILVEEFGDKEFTTKDVEEILQKRGLALENVSKLISTLRKERLVEAKEYPGDFRRNIYRLILLRPEIPTKRLLVKMI